MKSLFRGDDLMNTTAPNIRSAYWDNIKGILILLVVFAHILFQLQTDSVVINATVDSIYMFHMPAFVFISGFFGKSERSHSFESIIKLIFLFYIFNSIMGFIYGFGSLLQPVYSYWYLIAIIAWRVITPHIAKFKEIGLILFITALFVGFYPSVDNTFAAARIIGFYPLYMLGYKLSQEQSDKLKNQNYAKRAALGLLLVAAAALLIWFSLDFFKFSDDDLQMAGYSDPIAAFGRVTLYVISFIVILAFRCLSPDRTIPLVTMFGKNSLWIFIWHRAFTLIASDLIKGLPLPAILLIAVAGAIVICILFGNPLVARFMNRFVQQGADIFLGGDKKFNLAKLATLGVSLWFIISVVLTQYAGISWKDLLKVLRQEPLEQFEENESENSEEDILYPIMTGEQKKKYDSAFRITFAGDLILLEDQVKRAYNGETYDFSEVFEYAQPYIASADYAIGVFEGPMAGAEVGYTSGNFDDSKELYLNFPDEFAAAVKNAGFDLVTNANNHVLDKGSGGVLRTIDVLDHIGLDHIGSYKSEEDKQNKRVKIVECQGIKMAILSYTYGSNNFRDENLIHGQFSFATSVICSSDSEYFDGQKAMVEEDFRKAKEADPDLIIVLPHIGTQFSNEPDKDQEVWFNIFKENGADIILGDHAHVVEPVRIDEYNGKNVYMLYCPGNFANLYRENQGDTSLLADVYIDRETKKVIGGSIVPLYTYAPADGNYRAVPIFEIMNNTELRKQLTTDDIKRAENSLKLITKVVFGHEMSIDNIPERYYFDETGFIRSKTTGLTLSEEMKEGTLYQAMSQANSICFIGDSVTEGTKNGGCPWYEPIEEHFKGKTISNSSKGGCTVSYMTAHASEIPVAELYVIALGTNDVRYRDESKCAMTSGAFTEEINTLKSALLAATPNARFVFIAPWYSTDGDPFCSLSFAAKTALNTEYCEALEKYCAANSLDFINANEYIQNTLVTRPDREYLLDHIHPNAAKGVIMYSEAVLSCK